jgi:hypothetical protein
MVGIPQPQEAVRSIRGAGRLRPANGFQQLGEVLVFDLTMAHLHRLIAPHIITKFPA